MERPKCRLCGARHYTHEAHTFADANPAKELIASSKARRAASGLAPVPDLPAAPEACPVCEERNRKAADRVRRHRERKAKHVVPALSDRAD
jgi:hypothetical protein